MVVSSVLPVSERTLWSSDRTAWESRWPSAKVTGRWTRRVPLVPSKLDNRFTMIMITTQFTLSSFISNFLLRIIWYHFTNTFAAYIAKRFISCASSHFARTLPNLEHVPTMSFLIAWAYPDSWEFSCPFSPDSPSDLQRPHHTMEWRYLWWRCRKIRSCCKFVLHASWLLLMLVYFDTSTPYYRAIII